MRDSIFLRNADGSLVRMRKAPYDSEDLLQRLLAEHPDLLAGDRMVPGAPRRWVLVSREAGVPGSPDGGSRWSLDHLFLDQDAVPTLVEVKRSSDTRLRREVVGQMLDYAANAVEHWSLERLRADFERTCEVRGTTPEAALCELLEDDADGEAFWSQVKTNLQAGRLRLVFVADEIPAELQRIIEFMNGQMDPATVLGVEVPQFVGERLQTLVPRVVGVTMEAQLRKAAGGRAPRIARDELVGAFPDRSAAAVSDFLDRCERQGLKVEMGSTGCSVRMRPPDGSKPLSVAWIFPPGVTGWMSLRGIAVGCERSLLSPDSAFAPAFQPYLEAVSSLPAVEDEPSGFVAAVEVGTDQAAEQLPIVSERIADLRERLEELCKDPDS